MHDGTRAQFHGTQRYCIEVARIGVSHVSEISECLIVLSCLIEVSMAQGLDAERLRTQAASEELLGFPGIPRFKRSLMKSVYSYESHGETW